MKEGKAKMFNIAALLVAYFVFLTLVDSNRHFCSHTVLCYDENGDRLHTMTKKGKPKSTHDVCVLSTGRSVVIFFNLSKPLDH